MFIFFNYWLKFLNIDFENMGKNLLILLIFEEDLVMMMIFLLILLDFLLFFMKLKRLNNIEIGMNIIRSENVIMGRKMLRILLIKVIFLFDFVFVFV